MVSIRDAMLVYRTLSDNGSVLAFCEAVFWRSAFATRCWFTAFSVVIGRSAFATPCWFTALSVVMGECWLSVRLFLTVIRFWLSFFRGSGTSLGWGTQCLPWHCLQVLAVISALATRRVSIGSKGRGCSERQSSQMPQDPSLHQSSTNLARSETAGGGVPESLGATSASSSGAGRSLSRKNFLTTRVRCAPLLVGRHFWPICPFGARNGEILPEFLLLRCRPRKGRFFICSLRAEMGEIWPEFLPLRCRPRNGRFYEKRGVSGPSVLLVPEMVKFCRNFCSCAVDLEMAVFPWKRAVSGPSALLGPEMVKFSRNFCSCAVDLEMAVFNWKRAISGPSALLGPEMVKFCRNFCSCVVDLEMAVFNWKRAISGTFALLGPEMVKFRRNFCSCAVDLEMIVFKWKRAVSGPFALLWPKTIWLQNAQKRSGRGFKMPRNGLGEASKRPETVWERLQNGQQGPRECQQKPLGLGFIPLHLRGRAP